MRPCACPTWQKGIRCAAPHVATAGGPYDVENSNFCCWHHNRAIRHQHGYSFQHRRYGPRYSQLIPYNFVVRSDLLRALHCADGVPAHSGICHCRDWRAGRPNWKFRRSSIARSRNFCNFHPRPTLGDQCMSKRPCSGEGRSNRHRSMMASNRR
jgi:hypothetical protein